MCTLNLNLTLLRLLVISSLPLYTCMVYLPPPPALRLRSLTHSLTLMLLVSGPLAKLFANNFAKDKVALSLTLRLRIRFGRFSYSDKYRGFVAGTVWGNMGDGHVILSDELTADLPLAGSYCGISARCDLDNCPRVGTVRVAPA